MQTAFLIIISILGSIYALLTKQMKLAAGLLVLTLAFVLQIPNLVTGFWIDVLLALSLIVFTVGIFILVWQKKDSKLDNTIKDEEVKKDEDKAQE